MVKLDLDLDPDPHSEKLLDPDPHKMNADPHSTALVYFMLIWIEVKTSIRIRIQMIVPDVPVILILILGTPTTYFFPLNLTYLVFTLLDPDLHIECGSGSRRENECGSGSAY